MNLNPNGFGILNEALGFEPAPAGDFTQNFPFFPCEVPRIAKQGFDSSYSAMEPGFEIECFKNKDSYNNAPFFP
jgi:hypothetical protein